MFAIITVALISGAVADRLRFGAWLLFAGLWATVVYFPVAHWVFAFDGVTAETGGWIANKLARDRLRRWYRGPHQRRHRRPGPRHRPRQAQGLAGHADAAAQPAVRDARRRPAVVRLVRLQRRLRGRRPTVSPVRRSSPPSIATCAAMLAWLLVERIRDGNATTLGAASGIVAGLVAITPACSSVNVARRAGHRRHRGRAVRARGRPEVQASATTTRSTSSASTWSAAWSAPC